MEKIYTKPPMLLSSIRMPRRDADMIIQGARLEGISRSEFLRKSGVERARRALRKAARDEVTTCGSGH
jgi:hypothetical protein